MLGGFGVLMMAVVMVVGGGCCCHILKELSFLGSWSNVKSTMNDYYIILSCDLIMSKRCRCFEDKQNRPWSEHISRDHGILLSEPNGSSVFFLYRMKHATYEVAEAH